MAPTAVSILHLQNEDASTWNAEKHSFGVNLLPLWLMIMPNKNACKQKLVFNPTKCAKTFSYWLSCGLPVGEKLLSWLVLYSTFVVTHTTGHSITRKRLEANQEWTNRQKYLLYSTEGCQVRKLASHRRVRTRECKIKTQRCWSLWSWLPTVQNFHFLNLGHVTKVVNN